MPTPTSTPSTSSLGAKAASTPSTRGSESTSSVHYGDQVLTITAAGLAALGPADASPVSAPEAVERLVSMWHAAGTAFVRSVRL